MRLFRQYHYSEGANRLETPRLFLRLAQDRDWNGYAELRSASRTFLQPWEPTWPTDALTKASFHQRVARYRMAWRDDSGYNFLIFADGLDGVNVGELVGGIGVTNIRRGVAQAGTLGYWMGVPFVGQGLMGEALRAVLDYCFDGLDLHRVEAACLPSNERSRRLLESGGFDREGYAEKYLKIHGAWQDHLLFALNVEAWTQNERP